MSIILDIKLPSANDYIKACRTNKYTAAKMKADAENILIWLLKKMPRYEEPVAITFTWVEKDRRRDPDNISFGAKFILDAMQKAGKIPNDNQMYIRKITHEFVVSAKTYCIVDVEPIIKE
jgi:Holliday junction resolvase RusA-like endonuclease